MPHLGKFGGIGGGLLGLVGLALVQAPRLPDAPKSAAGSPVEPAAWAGNHPIAPGVVGDFFESEPVLPRAQARTRRLWSNLLAASRFAEAAEWAAAGEAAPDRDQLRELFAAWARQSPAEARAALGRLPEAQRSAAWTGLIAGWSVIRPAEAARFAAALVPGEVRTLALGVALENWVRQDPAAVSTWLGQFPRDPAFDAGRARLIALTDELDRPVEVALYWAAGITDDAMRREVAFPVWRRWHQRDPAGAVRFLASLTWLLPVEKTQWPVLARRPTVAQLE